MLVIVIDTLRADHALGNAARTPNIDALAREGISFTRTFPEAMPTVPARNSLLSGRRVFPFRGWFDRRGLIQMPGWEPLADVGTTFTSALRQAGYWTGYVTDNPFLGFSRPYEQFRQSFDLFVKRGGQIGGRSDGVSPEQLDHWVHPATRDPKTVDRVRHYIANADYAHDESKSFAASVFGSGVEALDTRRARAPPLGARGRHLRAARALDAAQPLPRPVRRARLPRAGAGDAALRPGRELAGSGRGARRCCAGCARSTRPRSR